MSFESLASTRNDGTAVPPVVALPASPPLGSGRYEIAWIVLLFFVMGGAVAPAINEPHYLSRAKHFWDPDFCPGDLFLESRDAHPVFFAAFGWITRWLSLPASAWIGRFVGWTLLAMAWYRLSSSLVPRRGASLLAAAIWITLVVRGHMSGEWLIGGIEAKVIAYAGVLVGLSEWVRGNPRRTWIWYGVASAFHVLVGGWATVMTIIAGLRSGIDGPRALVRSLPGAGIGLLIALVGLLPALRLNADVPPDVVRRAAEIYTFDRLAHHLMIRDFGALLVLRHALLILLFAAICYGLKPDCRFARLSGVVWAAVLLVCMGLAIDVLLGHSTWGARGLRFYWFRASDVFVPLGISLGITLYVTRSSGVVTGVNRALLAVVLLLIGGNLVVTAASMHRQPIPAADLQGGIHEGRQWTAWLEVCDWVRDHIPVSSMVLTPTDHQTFKWYAHRAEVVTWKDVPQNAAAIVEWSTRLARIRHWQQSKTLGESNARFGALVDDYGFQYAVVRRPAPHPMPDAQVVYQNAYYLVLRVVPRESVDPLTMNSSVQTASLEQAGQSTDCADSIPRS